VIDAGTTTDAKRLTKTWLPPIHAEVPIDRAEVPIVARGPAYDAVP
jgi:hypothetical protein